MSLYIDIIYLYIHVSIDMDDYGTFGKTQVQKIMTTAGENSNLLDHDANVVGKTQNIDMHNIF